MFQEWKRNLQVLKPLNLRARLLLGKGLPTIKHIEKLNAAMTLLARDLLVNRLRNLKAVLTVKVVHHLQARHLPVHQMLDLKATLIMRAAYCSQDQKTRQQHPTSHRPSNPWDKVAHRKQGPPDQRRRLVPKLLLAALPGRTFLS